MRTRAASPPSDTHFRDLSAFTQEDPTGVGPWLVEGAAELADALAVRGPLTELLLLVYGRRSPETADVAVLGDDQLLDFWLKRVAFG